MRIHICTWRFKNCLHRLFENGTSPFLNKVQVGMEHWLLFPPQCKIFTHSYIVWMNLYKIWQLLSKFQLSLFIHWRSKHSFSLRVEVNMSFHYIKLVHNIPISWLSMIVPHEWLYNSYVKFYSSRRGS